MTRYVSDEVCKETLNAWGKQAQMMAVLEEMSELQKEVLKNINRRENNVDKIAEETADVLIMLDQLMYIYKIRDLVKEISISKLNRLRKYLDDAKRTSAGN